ncbi:MAG: hypothetical protein E7261_07015 [Lachnospiraceae bacterium]|nr:hypothetical protein [Lachnospiraceae bacterium]
MHPYSEAYLQEVVETQGKLFDEVADYEKGIDVEDFIKKYMASRTREFIDNGQAYVCTLDAKELWIYFCKNDKYELKKGEAIGGFSADWIGRFYAYFQWYYNMTSKKVLELVPLDFIRAAYNGLHDLELDLAVKKVGEQVVA